MILNLFIITNDNFKEIIIKKKNNPFISAGDDEGLTDNWNSILFEVKF